MTFWRRWFGRRPTVGPLPPEPPPGTVRVGDTALVALPGADATFLLDLDAFDFRYGEERRKRPDPSQRDLDALLPAVTRVRVRAGGMLEGRALPWPVLIDTSDPTSIAALRACLVLAPPTRPPGHGHCGCLGGPTLELFAGDALAASISIQHKAAIRWSRWRPDAPLRSGPALERWLADHGLDAALLEVLSRNPFAMARIPAEGSAEPLTAAGQKLFLARILAGRRAPGALEACTEALRLDPTLTEALVLRSSVREDAEDREGALLDLAAAIEQAGPHPDLLFRRGVLLDALGRSDEALDALDRALIVDPAHANALNSRGVVRMRAGDLGGALRDLTCAVEVAPEWELPYANRAGLLDRLGDAARAAADRREAARLSHGAASA